MRLSRHEKITFQRFNHTIIPHHLTSCIYVCLSRACERISFKPDDTSTPMQAWLTQTHTCSINIDITFTPQRHIQRHARGFAHACAHLSVSSHSALWHPEANHIIWGNYNNKSSYSASYNASSASCCLSGSLHLRPLSQGSWRPDQKALATKPGLQEALRMHANHTQSEHVSQMLPGMPINVSDTRLRAESHLELHLQTWHCCFVWVNSTCRKKKKHVAEKHPP